LRVRRLCGEVGFRFGFGFAGLGRGLEAVSSKSETASVKRY